MLMVLTDSQMISSASKALRDAQQALAEAQVKVSEAMSTIAIFEDRFNKGEYKRDDLGGMTLTTAQVNSNLDSAIEIGGSTKDTDRINAQMQEYMSVAKAKQDEADAKKRWTLALSNCQCGSPHVKEIDPNYSKAGDFVA